jgi:hypothetical protein
MLDKRSLGLFAVMSSVATTWADAAAACKQNEDRDRAIRGCTALIEQDPRSVEAYDYRGKPIGRKAPTSGRSRTKLATDYASP